VEDKLGGLDLLAAAVVLLDADLNLVHANAAAESAFGLSRRTQHRRPFGDLFVDPHELLDTARQALATSTSFVGPELSLRRPGLEPILVQYSVSPVEIDAARVIIEMRQVDQQIHRAREEHLADLQRSNRELIRNLAHEIKNPLGGIRGSAQLLEGELGRAELREYTRVIIDESDRLQRLMDRLLSPHVRGQKEPVNIHEVLERVRALIGAEFPRGLQFVTDYDVSIPPLPGEREQLIQALLNIVRNAAQAIASMGRRKRGEIALRTRVARQITLGRRRWRLAAELRVTDNGPGIAEDIRERIFLPLVSGRDGGSGLGLTLAQDLIHRHDGAVHCDSRPGATSFIVLLPIS
jgi:two-component system nitrogen regulation sensor histidine kinase GlnL